MEKIILEIDEMGEVKGHIEGLKGPICTKVKDWLTRVLGNHVKSTPKKEYHQHEVVKVR